MEMVEAFPVRWGLVRFNLGQKSWSDSPQAWLKGCWVAVLGAPDGQRFVSHIPGHSPGMFEPEWKWVEEREVKDDDIAVNPDRRGSHLLKKVSAG